MRRCSAGFAPSAFQSAITGSCEDGAGLSQVNADGTVECTNEQSSSTRVITGSIEDAPNTGVTLLSIPGVAHVEAVQCTGSVVVAEIVNDDVGNVDLWSADGASFDFEGSTWDSSTTPQVVQSGNGTIWQLGVGTGPGAEVIQVTADENVLGGGQCIFQASAQVITAAS